MIRPQGGAQGVSIDLTPIIDMVFLLLIFFLVATTFHQTEREMQIALPQARSAGPISAALKEIVVNVDQEGRIFVGGGLMSLESLRALVADRVARNPAQKVTVRGDHRSAYGHVAAVLDACKQAGVVEPFLDMIPVGSGG
jgi:biopolymer transport protein ExbD